jgi:regulator of sigma E protease
MIISFLYGILTVLGLGMLIFIHELGHYYMARKTGMRVEVFSIGFGRPIVTWEWGDVQWKICMIPFGGYVKIFGEQKEENVDVYDIPGGFFSKTPWQRIKVSFMGPFFNIVFAFVVFSLIWAFGGREKQYHEFSSHIGWVASESELFVNGIRPGDKIVSYDDKEFINAQDHISMAMMSEDDLLVKGVHYTSDFEEESFEYVVKPYSLGRAKKKDIVSSGVVTPAQYLMYDKFYDGSDNSLKPGAPIASSGIDYGDRIVWVDGEPMFSLYHLRKIVNDEKILLTVRRGDETKLVRIPRCLVSEFKLNSDYLEEIEDWQHEAGLSGNLLSLYFVPYNLTWDCRVEEAFSFIDSEEEEEAFSGVSRKEDRLQVGDTIVAIYGEPVKKSYDLFKKMQKRKLSIIVERNGIGGKKVLWKDADSELVDVFKDKDLGILASYIGGEEGVRSVGRFTMLDPVEPLMRKDYPMTKEERTLYEKNLQEEKVQLEEMLANVDNKSEILRQWEERQKNKELGVALLDKMVEYNPNPFALFADSFENIWRVLYSLVSGALSPKWLAGPVGMMQVIHFSWTHGVFEVLFWLGVLSLNLGVLNLLPIPVLDGGTICFSFMEMVTKKRLKVKVMEKIIFVFVVALITLVVFVTYQDIRRIVEYIFSSYF